MPNISQPTRFNPYLKDLLPLLRQRNSSNVLNLSLQNIINVTTANAGALFFRSILNKPINVQHGELPDEAKSRIKRWQNGLFTRLKENRTFKITAQALLTTGQTLIELPLLANNMVVGHLCLLLPSSVLLNDGLTNKLYILCTMTSHLTTLLQELEKSKKRLKRLKLLHEIGQKLTSELDLVQLLQDTMALAAKALKAQTSVLMLTDPQNPNYLISQVAYGDKKELLRRHHLPKSEGVAGWVARTGKPALVNSPNNDKRFNRRVDLRTGYLTRNILCVPIKMKGEIIGVLQLLNKLDGEDFNEEDEKLLLTLASQAAIAIENARLYHNLQQEPNRIIAAQENIRKELSRNLHDSTLQHLSAMSMLIEHIKKLSFEDPELMRKELAVLAELNERSIRESRTLLFELRPVVLETRGLGAALEAYVQQLRQTGRLSTARLNLILSPELPRLMGHVEQTIFAIVQEAVGNARKHAKASQISVQIEKRGVYLLIYIKDDGMGFNLKDIQSKYETSGSLGLLNMEERAQLIEAKLHMESTPGKGTSVMIGIPLSRQVTSSL